MVALVIARKTNDLWTELSDQIYNFLSGISLGNLVSRQTIQDVAARQDGNQKINLDTVERETVAVS